MQIEHPSLRRLFTYWDTKRAGRIAPARYEIDPVDLPDILPHLFIYRVIDGGADFRMSLFGTALVEAFRRDFTGESFENIFKGPDRDAIHAEYRQVAVEARPGCARHDASWINREHVEYERLLLPLSDDGKTVNRLLGGTYFDRFET